MMHGERGRGRGVHMMGSCFSGCIRELCHVSLTTPAEQSKLGKGGGRGRGLIYIDKHITHVS